MCHFLRLHVPNIAMLYCKMPLKVVEQLDSPLLYRKAVLEAVIVFGDFISLYMQMQMQRHHNPCHILIKTPTHTHQVKTRKNRRAASCRATGNKYLPHIPSL